MINYFGLVPNDASSSSKSSSSSTSSLTYSASQSKLYLIDLPGFGYASAPDESVDEWQRKTQEFLISRASVQQSPSVGTNEFGEQKQTAPPLKRLYLLLDSRLPNPPMIDLIVMGWCDEYSIPYTIVLTKVDGSSRANCVKLTNQMCMRYHSLFMESFSNAMMGGEDGEENEDGDDDDVEVGEVYMDPVVYWTSAKDGLGMEELLLSVENNMFVSEMDYDVENQLEDDEEEEEEEEEELKEDGSSRL